MGDDLEERLKGHAEAFEGLLALTPAKTYFGEDTTDQWKRKKATKEDKKQARKAKLNASGTSSAADVMRERELKRKREEAGAAADDEDADQSAPTTSTPNRQPKKQRTSDAEGGENGEVTPEDTLKRTEAEKRREKRQRQKEKKAKLIEKAEAKKARKQDLLKANPAVDEEDAAPKPEQEDSEDEEDATLADMHAEVDEMEGLELEGLVEDGLDGSDDENETPADQPGSPDSVEPTATSSTSSIVPPSNPDESSNPDVQRKARPGKIPIPQIDPDVLKARLQAKIESLRAARKASGTDGRPVRSRQELIEARRAKQQQRKQHKKEQRKQAKLDEDKSGAEAELARLRGSGSPLTGSDMLSPDVPDSALSFGRIAFQDGARVDPSMAAFLNPTRRKGPQDPKGALEAAQRKQQRIQALDPAKRAEIESKELWLNAKKKAQGEKVKDDTSLLKKALKKKQKQKEKSATAWTERTEAVVKGKEAKQKKREENLRKRRDEKGVKGKKGKKPSSSKGRAGFEGSFKSKSR